MIQFGDKVWAGSLSNSGGVIGQRPSQQGPPPTPNGGHTGQPLPSVRWLDPTHSVGRSTAQGCMVVSLGGGKSMFWEVYDSQLTGGHVLGGPAQT